MIDFISIPGHRWLTWGIYRRFPHYWFRVWWNRLGFPGLTIIFRRWEFRAGTITRGRAWL